MNLINQEPMNPDALAPVYLLHLHKIMEWMVTNKRIQRQEALDILQKAGLTYDPINGVWLDEVGAVYTMRTDI